MTYLPVSNLLLGGTSIPGGLYLEGEFVLVNAAYIRGGLYLDSYSMYTIIFLFNLAIYLKIP